MLGALTYQHWNENRLCNRNVFTCCILRNLYFIYRISIYNLSPSLNDNCTYFKFHRYYFHKKYFRMQKDFPNLSKKEIAGILSARWSQLPTEEKQVSLTVFSEKTNLMHCIFRTSHRVLISSDAKLIERIYLTFSTFCCWLLI